ncbi:MAG: Cytochrome c-551 [Stenotrophomonas maltophilia]|nr:MAG: Cytochrome c-551 [Stenotrophomonas maltophilia]
MPTVKGLLACLLLLCPLALSATPRSIELPPETARLEVSSLPGYAIANQKCTICHSADYIQLQPHGMSTSQWRATVAKMQYGFGAPVDDAQGDLIAAYLADAYSGKPHAAVTLAPAVPAAGKQDAMSLLQNNGCLGCHALDHKVVGPAYQDVARKYRGDTSAGKTLAEHINQGGIGRWGQIPMPPFPQLSANQLKTLTDFILSQ